MKRFLSLILVIGMLMAAIMTVTSCKKEEKGKDKSGIGYTIEQDKYLFGMGEMPNLFGGGATDSKATAEMTANLTGAMKAQSYRIWMHLTSVLEREPDSDKVSLKADRVKIYHEYIDKLKAQGITHFTAMSHYYLYPYGFSGGSLGNVIPDPETEDYTRFLNILRECYKLLSAEFPEVVYWEPGNETNSARFIAKQGYLPGGSDIANEDYMYTQKEQAEITTDISYYCNLGLKDNGKGQVTVLSGMVFEGLAAEYFLEDIYLSIESGKFPRGDAAKDTISDNYFEVLNWHPYQFGNSSAGWVENNKKLYAVAQKYGDDGKKVFLTELGIPDRIAAQVPSDKEGNIVWEEYQNNAAEWMVNQFKDIKEHMPFVETVHIFRLFDWKVNVDPALPADSIEKTFGLFTTPNNTTFGPQPKPVAIALLQYFQGESVDITGLYQYSVKK